jgi:thiol-disulfide isomerase/thioredoxin
MKNLKNILLLTGSLIFGSSITAFSNSTPGIKFEHASWEEVKAKAKRLDKPIFVDFYASWCGPCVWMSKDVFTDNGVGEFFNENFISLKIDAENNELDLVESIDLEAYPTLVFFDTNGNVLLKKVGALDTEELINNGRKVISFSNNAEKIEHNQPHSFEEFNDYLSILKMTEPKRAEEMAVNWLKKETSAAIANEQQWQLVSQFIMDAESPYFEYVIENAGTLYTQYDGFLDYIVAVQELIQAEAIAIENIELINLAADIDYEVLTAIDGVPDNPRNYYLLNKQYQYHKLIGEYDKYVDLYNQYLTQYEMDNWDELTDAVLAITEHEDSQNKHYEMALVWAEAAYKAENNFYTNYTLSRVQFRLDDYVTADKFLKSTREFSEADEYVSLLEDYEVEINKFL